MADRSHGDRVRAVLARSDLSHDERLHRAATLKAQAHATDSLNEWSVGGVRIVVDRVEYDALLNLVRMWPRAYSGDIELELDLPYQVHNPPLTADGVTEDVPAALRAIVTDFVLRSV